MESFCIVWKFEKPPPVSFEDVWSDSDADGTEGKEIDERSRADGWLPSFSILIDDTHSSSFQLRTTGVLRAGEIRVDGTGSTGKGVRFGDNVETKSSLRYYRWSGHRESSSCRTCEAQTSFSLNATLHDGRLTLKKVDGDCDVADTGTKRVDRKRMRRLLKDVGVGSMTVGATWHLEQLVRRWLERLRASTHVAKQGRRNEVQRSLMDGSPTERERKSSE